MKFIVVVALYLAVTAALPVDVVEDEYGQQYYMIPISREKRDVNWGASNQGFKLGSSGTIVDNNNHRLDGSAYAAKSWTSHGIQPDQAGGRLDYLHKPSASTAFVGADHTRHFGTDANAGVKYNIVNKKDFDVDLTGQYGRHFGGLQGTGKPEASVFLNLEKKF